MGGMSKAILPILRVRVGVSLIIQRQRHLKLGIRFPVGWLLKGQPLSGPLGYIRYKSPLGINYGTVECLSVTCFMHMLINQRRPADAHARRDASRARLQRCYWRMNLGVN